MWETLSASFGHYALILLMSPRLIVLVICSENERTNHMWGLYGNPLDRYRNYTLSRGHN